jgi:hypothetical protein
VVGAERRLRFLVGPADAIHVDEVAPTMTAQEMPDSRLLVDLALHRRVRRFEVVTAGGDFQIFHYRSLLP